MSGASGILEGAHGIPGTASGLFAYSLRMVFFNRFSFSQLFILCTVLFLFAPFGPIDSLLMNIREHEIEGFGSDLPINKVSLHPPYISDFWPSLRHDDTNAPIACGEKETTR